MNSFLTKIGLLNDNGKISLTNSIVYIFVFITGFRALFAGATIHLYSITWSIQSLDFSSSLTLLFSLLNYHGKRMVNSNTQSANIPDQQ